MPLVKNTNRLKVKVWKITHKQQPQENRIGHINIRQKIFKNITRDKKGHFVMMIGSVHEEDTQL